jgi:hypothetical protein
VARMIQARDRGTFRGRTEKTGKCVADETGKYLVNKNDEGIFASVSIRGASTVIASEAKQSRVVGGTLDCFVAALLAMTMESDYAWLATVLPSAACAAARRAIGTR